MNKTQNKKVMIVGNIAHAAKFTLSIEKFVHLQLEQGLNDVSAGNVNDP